MIELYRNIIPASKLINDNSGQHYNILQGKTKYLSAQFQDLFCKLETGPGGYSIPDLEGLFLPSNGIYLYCEIWRCTNIKFDPQNYSTTFKSPLDLLVTNGYIKDDSWRYIKGIMYCGGGRDAWYRAIRVNKNDGLPENLTPEWWKENCSDNYSDALIRIIIDD